MNTGGAEQQLVRVASGLRSRNIDTHVATVHEGANDNLLVEAGVTTHRLHSSSKYDPLVWPRLIALCRHLQPDVIQTWLTQMDILGGTAAKLLRIPWVLSERSVGAAYPATMLNRSRAAIGARSDAIVANSEGGRQYWRGYVKDDARLRVIPNIVPHARIKGSVPDRFVHSSMGDVILYVGRLSEEKNVDLLLEALAIVLQRSCATAVFCGDGPLRTRLENRAAALGVAHRVKFLGFVNNVWSWMNRAGVMVSVSRFEGDPNSVLEGIVCGTPLVVSDIAAHRSILDDQSAWLVNLSSPASIAAGLQAALSDPTEATKRAARAARALKSRSAAEIAARFEEVYRQVSEPVHTKAFN
jgi:glycosyltransferase involved in cell wall biosynthesis